MSEVSNGELNILEYLRMFGPATMEHIQAQFHNSMPKTIRQAMEDLCTNCFLDKRITESGDAILFCLTERAVYALVNAGKWPQTPIYTDIVEHKPTLTPEDCAFLWSMAIQADADIVV